MLGGIFGGSSSANERTSLIDQERRASVSIQRSFRGKRGREKSKDQRTFMTTVLRLGIDSREVWSLITVAMLLLGKASTPFFNSVITSVQTALEDDPSFALTTTQVGSVNSAKDMTEGFSKLLVGPVLWLLGLRNVWLLMLGVAAVNMLLVPIGGSLPFLYASVTVQALIYAWIFPATTMVIAGWIDGHQLGKALGIVAVATKISPSVMAPLYAQFVGTGVDGWKICYYVSAVIAGCFFLLEFVFLRSSAASLGFREPTPPGKAPSQGAKSHDEEGGSAGGASASRLMSKSRLTHPLARESTCSVMLIVVKMRRTWALLAAFTLLCLCKQGSHFASVYAKHRLGVSASESSQLSTTYNIAAACAGLFGGVLYDLVPGGKLGIGVLMTSMNVLNLIGFVIALVFEVTGTVTMGGLHAFMGIIGFASVLPVSLPFQVYSMAVGGVKHCAVIVATFEFVAHFVEAAVDLATGEILDADEYTLWLVINVGFATLGTLTMALFYYLDWRRAPNASSLTAAPDLNTRDKKSIARSLRWAAGQAETSDEIAQYNKERVLSAFTPSQK